MTAAAEKTAEERHASWLELFFDLVVVVAVAQLAHLLHGEPGIGAIGLFVMLYYAVWSVWTSFTLYANVAGQRTGTRAMLLAMFGIAVMAAAIPQAAHDRGAIFAIAYVVCRLLAIRTWRGTGTIMTAWPAAQVGAGFLPWLISIWTEPPTRYWLWGVGIAADIIISIIQSRHPDRLIKDAQTKAVLAEQAATARAARAAKTSSRVRRPQTGFLPPVAARLDIAHLGERLGLFIIIVLGEAVAQVVSAAAEVNWSRALWLTALAGFGLLVCLWWLTLEYGSSSTPGPVGYGVPAWLAMPGHFAMTVAITAIAAGLGSMAEHPAGHMGTGIRWVLCGGMALYFLTTMTIGVLTKAPRRWLAGWAAPAVVLPLLLGTFGGALPSWSLAVGLLAAAAWQTLYPRLGAAHPQPA